MRPLAIVFVVDALITTGFGLVSWLAPESTFGTLVDLGGPGSARSLLLATLASLSLFYVLLVPEEGEDALTALFPATSHAPFLRGLFHCVTPNLPCAEVQASTSPEQLSAIAAYVQHLARANERV